MNIPFRTKTIATALGLAGALLANAALADTLKIGLVRPTTGAVKQYGDMVQEGVDTAVEMANAAGGINRRQVQLVIEDDKEGAGRRAPREVIVGIQAAA